MDWIQNVVPFAENDRGYRENRAALLCDPLIPYPSRDFLLARVKGTSGLFH